MTKVKAATILTKEVKESTKNLSFLKRGNTNYFVKDRGRVTPPLLILSKIQLLSVHLQLQEFGFVAVFVRAFP